MKKTFNIMTIACITGLFLASCGNSADNSATQNEHAHHEHAAETSEPTSSTAESTSASTSSNTLVVESNDQMQFNVNELKVKAGEPIHLTLKHVGKMAKEVMGHNLVVLKAGSDVTKFAESAINAKDTDYIPAGGEVIAHTKLIGGGEETSIDFTLTEAGTYDFICSFPGHVGIMKGKIIAE